MTDIRKEWIKLSEREQRFRNNEIRFANSLKYQAARIRGEYVLAMIEDGNAHPFAIYSQAVKAFSLALDALGRK